MTPTVAFVEALCATGPSQSDLFDADTDPRAEALRRLRERVLRFASGLSRIKDFALTAWSGHAVGVEIGEMSEPALLELARVIVDYGTPAFVDSGAFGVFMRGLRRAGAVRPLDFDAILNRYDTLLDMICDYNAAEERVPAPYFVMPDIVGDQLASLDLIRKHKDYVSAAIFFRGVSRPIIPIQRGPLDFAEIYRRLTDLLGSDDFIVGIPSNAEAVTPKEFTEFLADAQPRAVHILGAFADSRVTPRLLQILDAGAEETVAVSADANPLRSIIIQSGQGAEGRRDALVSRLGLKARRQALRDLVDHHGGPTPFLHAFREEQCRGDRRKPILELSAYFSDQPQEIVRRRLDRR